MSQITQQSPIESSPADTRRVLIVDRDSDSMRALQGSLARAGFTVTTLGRGEDALAAIDRDRPHLVMLDWEYPGIAASSLIWHLRRDAPPKRARLMALSQFSGEQQIVSGFELGVDDYVVKPCSIPVLVARVRAILRDYRTQTDTTDILEFHRLRMDLSDQRLMAADRIVPLRPMEFRLVEFLMRYPERVFTREQLLSQIWTRGARVDARAVDVNVQRTRRALGDHGCGHYLQTVRGFGYRLSVFTP